LPNSADQFAKLRNSPRQNSAAYCSLLFARKLSSILLEKLHFLEAGVMLSSANNIQRKLWIFFFSKVQFVN